MPDTDLSHFVNGYTSTAFDLLIALLLGALIGLQRGWASRDKEAGARVAGIRTYTLTALTGAIAGLLSFEISTWVLPAMLLFVAAISVTGYYLQASHSHNFSITGVIGLILTFCFGAMVMADLAVIAAMAAVITTLILENKKEIHALLNKLREHELDAALRLLLISVVLLPLLPKEGFGPGGVINLYEIWWLVVLIAAVSFIGYFAVRIAGKRKGLIFTSLFAGLSSSTALTLHFSRQARQTPSDIPILAAGILLACGTMFPRVLLYCFVIFPELAMALLLPMLAMTVSLYLPAGIIYLRFHDNDVSQPEKGSNPLELQSAVMLGGLMVVILLLASKLQDYMGDAGIYLLAAGSGVTDVDAISLLLSRLALADTISLATAATGVVIAVMVNNLVKTGIAMSIGRIALGWRILLPMLLSLLSGVALLRFAGS